MFYLPANTVLLYTVIGYMGDGFYRSKDPINSTKVLKKHTVHRQRKIYNNQTNKHKTQQIPGSTLIWGD